MAILAKGADPDALESAAQRLRALAGELDGVRGSVGGVASVLRGQWDGGDLDALLRRWTRLDGQVALAAGTVRRLGDAVARNAAQQRSTSAATSGTTSAVVPGGTPAAAGTGPATGTPDARLAALLSPAGACLAPAAQRIAVRALFDSLTPAERDRLATEHPAEVGNLSGAPFAQRALANRVQAATALAEQERVVEAARRRLADDEGDPWLRLLPDARDEVLGRDRAALADAQALATTYAHVAHDTSAQVVLFDPAHGRYAEVSGRIDAGTRDVGVLVPGTNTTMASIGGDVTRSRLFADAAPGRLAMVTWMGGHLPQGVEAASAGSSEDLAPRLAEFSHDVRQEADLATGRGTGTGEGADPGSGVRLTLMGHSYGGAVVGLSETYGSDADRVLHVESAGMGHDVWSPADLHPTEPDVQRYAMTAPGDPIAISQGVQVGDLGHGADPDEFPGVTRLPTGDDAQGREIHGLSAHSGVFAPGSDSWEQMLQVLVGR